MAPGIKLKGLQCQGGPQVPVFPAVHSEPLGAGPVAFISGSWGHLAQGLPLRKHTVSDSKVIALCKPVLSSSEGPSASCGCQCPVLPPRKHL